MTEMIERGAKAIDTALGGLLDDDGGRLSSEIEQKLKLAGRAAIEAMQKPTKEMYDASMPYMDSWSSNGAWWNAMIQAALGKVDA